MTWFSMLFDACLLQNRQARGAGARAAGQGPQARSRRTLRAAALPRLSGVAAFTRKPLAPDAKLYGIPKGGTPFGGVRGSAPLWGAAGGIFSFSPGHGAAPRSGGRRRHRLSSRVAGAAPLLSRAAGGIVSFSLSGACGGGHPLVCTVVITASTVSG